MEHIASEDRFYALMPEVAGKVISYVETHADLSSRPFGFDDGMISRDRKRVTTKFSCVSSSGGGRDQVAVIAVLTVNEGWELFHTLKLD